MPGEDVLARVLGVGALLDRFGQLVHFGRDVAQVGLACRAVAGGDQQLADALQGLADARRARRSAVCVQEMPSLTLEV